MRQNQALFANFILKFGSLNLIDRLSEIVVPAFTDDSLVRGYGDTHYYLLAARLYQLAPEWGNPAIIGRFVKDTYLKRTQILTQKRGLIKDELSMQSSPSAFFVLTLADHRLVYFAETAFAPDVNTFEVTIRHFLIRKYDSYINSIYDAAKKSGEQGVTKSGLRKEYPKPTLNIVPISSQESLGDYIDKYALLKRIEIYVHRRNDGVDFSDLMETVNEYNEQVGGEVTKIVTSEKAGLNKEGAKEALQGAVEGGNQSIRLKGVDEAGNELSGANTDFSVKAELDHVPSSAAWRARRLYREMMHLVEEGSLAAAAVAQDATERIRRALGGRG